MMSHGNKVATMTAWTLANSRDEQLTSQSINGGPSIVNNLCVLG